MVNIDTLFKTSKMLFEYSVCFNSRKAKAFLIVLKNSNMLCCFSSRVFDKGRISRIGELEIERYVNFFESSYKDNLEHCKFNIEKFPRWGIISGYYAMHDLTKLILAKKFRIKVNFKVHLTTIQLLREFVKNKELTKHLEKAYKEFLSLANDLEEAKKERTRVQYYTGTSFLLEEYKKRAKEFYESIVVVYINKILSLL